jgi:hypothetical protein
MRCPFLPQAPVARREIPPWSQATLIISQDNAKRQPLIGWSRHRCFRAGLEACRSDRVDVVDVKRMPKTRYE